MDKIWTSMYDAAKAVLNGRTISDYVSCGEVAAAVLSKSGKRYTASVRVTARLPLEYALAYR